MWTAERESSKLNTSLSRISSKRSVVSPRLSGTIIQRAGLPVLNPGLLHFSLRLQRKALSHLLQTTIMKPKSS